MIFKCKMCGATLNIEKDKNIVECEFCGKKQTVPVIKTKEIEELYDRANYFFHNNEYDKAASIYENISTENPYDPESYFMLALCKYGIEYVEDQKSKKRIPTLHRLHFDSIFNDINYKKAIKHADSSQKILYEHEAKYIDEVRNKILDISKKEKPYDVFICYKETDEKGQRTEDSVLAMDIYNELTKEGLKVFFSKVTLEDKLGIDYEPYIFAALNSAKVMVVVGTKPEYINAPWVRNEWTRFLDRINLYKSAKKNTEPCYIVPAYKGMSPYALPNEFSSVQAQDMSKVGATQDLVHGIKKLINRTNENNNNEAEIKSKSKKWKFITIASLLLIVGIALTIFINKKSNEVIIRGTAYVANKNYETVTFDGITDFGENDIQQLSKLKSVDNLYFKNCIMENLDFLYSIPNIKGVSFSSKTKIQNFDIKNICENIESFNYDYSSNSLAWDDLSFLTKMPNLVSICVPICDDLTPLSKLRNLEKITLRSQENSYIDNFHWCNGLDKVKKMHLSTGKEYIKFTEYDIFNGIENLKSLEDLYIYATTTRIVENQADSHSLIATDIEHISNILTLKKIDIRLVANKDNVKHYDGELLKFTNFKNLKNLEYIHLATKNTYDLSGLNNLEKLKTIEFYWGGSDIYNDDLTCLNNCPNLENISIYLKDHQRVKFDSNGKVLFVTDEYNQRSCYYDFHNHDYIRNFSLNGIDKMYKLKTLRIKINRWNTGNTVHKYYTEILNENLAKDNKHLEYSIEY